MFCGVCGIMVSIFFGVIMGLYMIGGVTEEDFDTTAYMVVDRATGEELDLAVFIQEVKGGYWEKAYAQTLAEYIGIAGTSTASVLAYLIKAKTGSNLVNGTVREIAEASGVTSKTVSNVFGKLKARGFLRKVRGGCYFISPKLIRTGGKVKGAMLLRLWGTME